MSAIPDKVRGLVKVRDRFLCVRCRTAGADLHHRRSRSVPGQHQHCTCDLVLLCRPCHRAVHSQPFVARGTGLIVSRYTNEPGSVLVDTVIGTLRLDCMGGFTFEERSNVPG